MGLIYIKLFYKSLTIKLGFFMKSKCPVSTENSEFQNISDAELLCHPENVPIYDIDFYSDEVIKDTLPHFTKMREMGPIVFIPKLGNYAITRYAEIREALVNWKIFSSAQGISADKFNCEYFREASNIVRDPPVHDEIRVVMAAPLLPKALDASIRSEIESHAEKLIDNLILKGEFDVVSDLSRYLPVTLVTELVGLPEKGRENMLKWAGAAFDLTGPQNERGKKAIEVLDEMREWINTEVTLDSLKPGSLTARVRDLVDRGELEEKYFLSIMNDYITAALDSTISATSQLIYQLGKNPDQWELLQKDGSLIPNAVNEAVRLGAPVRSFTRTVTEDYMLGGVTLPAGARVMILYGSANRDERQFENPEKFDVTRKTRDHVGFGAGKHQCVGMHLAKLEMESILTAMLSRVSRIEVGEPTIALNNTVHAYATLPAVFYT